MADMTDRTRRQLGIALGSHALAALVESRFEAGGSATLGGTAAKSMIILQRLAKAGMGRKAATLFVANLSADTDVVPFTQTRLAYTLGPGGMAAAKLLDDTLG
jgi:hypothetical protein